MAEPATCDLALYRGDDFTQVLEFTDNETPPEPLDLSSYTFRAQIRDRPDEGTIIYAEFDIDATDAADGKITLSLNNEITQIPSGYWDLEVDNGSTIQTWLKGSVKMSGDVTKELTP